MNIEDTIVAVSSPPGAAVRGIVRLSGPDAIRIADRLFHAETSERLIATPGPAYVRGRLRIGRSELPASIYLFRAPNSYTRQDVVEIHLLGAPTLLGIVLEACLAAGTRRAEPGEFTARAFLAGAFDLSQVHGIAGMIAAHSDLQLQAAERLLHGDLAETANEARERLADLLSLVEGGLDFADEPIEFIAPADLRERLCVILQSLETTAAAGLRAERWASLPQVLLIGPPNAGKSSLLNRLTGMERAISAPVAGTTRDMLSAPLKLGDAECLLIDCAGFRETAAEADAKAQSIASRAIGHADLLLYVADVSLPDPLAGVRALPAQPAPVILVANKSDRLPDDRPQDVLHQLTAATRLPVCLTSALTGAGCENLKKAVAAELQQREATITDSAIALMAEHREALQEAIDAVGRAIELAASAGDSLVDADLVAAELHAAANALGTLVGRDQTEDLLGRIFSRFCVGK